MDRISNLPDEIICHIGSFLSAKEVAFTKVVSKRWQNLINIIQGLRFDVSAENGESFKDFAEGLSSLPPSSRVKNFSLKWWPVETESDQYDRINACLRHVLKRGVLDLDLWINGEEGYPLPFEVFTSKTVAKLSLGSDFAIDILPRNVSLPSLKTLVLYNVEFYEFGGCCAFKTLLDASPLLEELILSGVNWEHWIWSRVVASLSLERLTIIRNKWDDYDDSDFKSISFDTPGLVYLEYSDYVPKEYLNVNLNSLVEAKIDLCPQENFIWSEDDATRFHLTNLLRGLKNVESLNLGSKEALEMFFVFREALPVFEKLSHLSVNQSDLCWFPLKVLIKKSPNLKTLTIDGALHYRGFTTARWGDLCHCVSEYSFLSSCPLQVLKITEYYGTPKDLTQMKYILENLACLELVEIHSSVTGKRRKAKLESDLQMLPRASSKCRFADVL